MTNNQPDFSSRGFLTRMWDLIPCLSFPKPFPSSHPCEDIHSKQSKQSRPHRFSKSPSKTAPHDRSFNPTSLSLSLSSCLFFRGRQRCRDYQSFRHKKQQTGRRNSSTELLTICVMRRKAGESLATPWNITGCSISPPPALPGRIQTLLKRQPEKKQDRDNKSAALEDNNRMLRSALSKTLNPS